MTPDAEAEAKFRRMALEVGLRNCGCRVSDHNRTFNAWAFAEGSERPIEIKQDIAGSVVDDDQIRLAIASLQALISGNGP